MTVRSRLHPDAALVGELRDRVCATLRPLIPRRAKVALLDFPAHSNPGDSAIWLGERAALRALGVGRPVYTCEQETYDRAALAGRIGDGVILFHGGGNLGDLYERHEWFREKVVREFPGNRIVQLPQSIQFRDPRALERARAAFNAHPDLTLLVRDERSLAIARAEFRCHSALCPDTAFLLAPRAGRRPRRRVLWLIRTDEEGAVAAEPTVTGQRVDWLAERRFAALVIDRRLRWGVSLRLPPGMRAALLRALQTPLASNRVRRGCRLLADAETVVTDRLHAHILCVLLGIPHVLLDNSYGKILNFHRTWTSGSVRTRWVGSLAEAHGLVDFR